MAKKYYISVSLKSSDDNGKTFTQVESMEAQIDTESSALASAVLQPFGYLISGTNHMLNDMKRAVEKMKS